MSDARYERSRAAVHEAVCRVLVADGRLRELVVRKVDGVPVGDSPWRERLLAAGFAPGYRGLALRDAR